MNIYKLLVFCFVIGSALGARSAREHLEVIWQEDPRGQRMIEDYPITCRETMKFIWSPKKVSFTNKLPMKRKTFDNRISIFLGTADPKHIVERVLAQKNKHVQFNRSVKHSLYYYIIVSELFGDKPILSARIYNSGCEKDDWIIELNEGKYAIKPAREQEWQVEEIFNGESDVPCDVKYGRQYIFNRVHNTETSVHSQLASANVDSSD